MRYASATGRSATETRTEAEAELFGRQVDMPRGKVVGGSSSINSMVYMRGHPLDYDRWAAELGLAQWRYADH